MASLAMSLSGLFSTGTVPSKHINFVSGETQMFRITTPFIIANMVENKDIFVDFFGKSCSCYPSEHKSVNQNFRPQITDTTISRLVTISSPIPTACDFVNGYLGEQTRNHFGVKAINFENISIHIPLLTYIKNKVKRFYPVKGWTDQALAELKVKEKQHG
jgi:hypothetical protein